MSPKPIIYENFAWYDFVEPSAADLQFLAQKFKFHPLDLEDCQTENQRPKIDEYPNYFFLVLHFPLFQNKTRRVTMAEVDLFFGADFIVTIHRGSLSPLTKIKAACQKSVERKKYLGRGIGYFLYELTSELFDYCFPIFDKLSKSTTELEKAVFDEEGETEDLVREIVLLRKNIIALRRILGPERPVIANLEHKNKKFLPDTLEIYFDDVVDKIEKLWHLLDSLKEVAETLQNANESLISHRTENTIKLLTVFSVILLPLTLLSGIFGMNVFLPFHESVWALGVIVLIMGLIAGAMFWFFRWQKLI